MSLLITEGLGTESPNKVLAVDSLVGQLVVHLNAAGVLTGDSLNPAKWVITGGGAAMTVTAVMIVGGDITLTTTEATNGASYVLLIPQGIVDAFTGYPCIGPFVWAFGGAGSVPTLVFARAIDARLLEIIFSEAVVVAEALNAANYLITGGGGLTVSTPTQVTDTTFRLVTTQQTPGQLYTVQASNIHDLFGNLI